MINTVALDNKANRLFSVTTQPTVEPIAADELKLFARIDDSTEDTLLESFIEAVRIAAEKWTNRAFIEQTITMYMDYWPGRVIELPKPPLISITAVEYYYEDGTTETYDSDNYYVITTGLRGRLIIKMDVDIPSNTDCDYSGYRITYKAGYGSGASDVPEPIKTALKIWATELYEGRATTKMPPPQAKELLRNYRVINR